MKTWLRQQFRLEEEKKKGKKELKKIYHHRTPRIAKANCMWTKNKDKLEINLETLTLEFEAGQGLASG